MSYKVLGEGTYGCVHEPSLKCDGDKDIDYTNKVSKIMVPSEATKELDEYLSIQRADPDNQFFLGVPLKCQPQNTSTTFNALTQCKLGYDADFKKGVITPTFDLLIMENGGMNLADYARTFEQETPSVANVRRLEDFWIEVHRLLLGLTVFKKENIMHHDLKAQNIVYNPNTNRSAFIDFGLMRPLSKSIRSSFTNINPTIHWSYPIETEFYNANIYYNADFVENRLKKIERHLFKNKSYVTFFNTVLPKDNSESCYDFTRTGMIERLISDYTQFLTSIKINDYQDLVKRSNETFDLYGTTMGLMYVLRKTKHLMKGNRSKLDYWDLFNLLYSGFSPNAFLRPSVEDFLVEYEELLKPLLDSRGIILKDHIAKYVNKIPKDPTLPKDPSIPKDPTLTKPQTLSKDQILTIPTTTKVMNILEFTNYITSNKINKKTAQNKLLHFWGQAFYLFQDLHKKVENDEFHNNINASTIIIDCEFKTFDKCVSILGNTSSLQEKIDIVINTGKHRPLQIPYPMEQIFCNKTFFNKTINYSENKRVDFFTQTFKKESLILGAHTNKLVNFILPENDNDDDKNIHRTTNSAYMLKDFQEFLKNEFKNDKQYNALVHKCIRKNDLFYLASTLIELWKKTYHLLKDTPMSYSGLYTFLYKCCSIDLDWAFNTEQAVYVYGIIISDFLKSIDMRIKNDKIVKGATSEIVPKKMSDDVLQEQIAKLDNKFKDKYCPPGKVINIKTGRCVNECKPGQMRNAEFKCVKDKTKKKPVDAPILPSAQLESLKDKEITNKKSLKQHKEKICPPGKVINTKTQRCIKDCKPGQIRNADFKCVKNKTKKNM